LNLKTFLRERPWIWIILGFVVMLAVMATMVVIAQRNEPATVPLDNPQSEQNAQ
jgi:hypothetical protein